MTPALKRCVYGFALLLAALGTATDGWGQRTQIANVRTTVDPQSLELIVTYDLVYLQPGDSLTVVFYVDGKPLRPQVGTVRGDIGLGVLKGANRQFRWNFTQEDLTGSRSLIAEVVGISIRKTGLFSGRRGHLALYGLVGSVALGGYGATLAGKVSKEVRAYNESPDPTTAQAEQALQEQKKAIGQKKTIFYVSVGAAAVLLIADGLLLSKNRRTNRPSLALTAPFGTPSATVAWVIR